LLPGGTWEIHADRPRAAAALVRELLSGATVAVYGDRLHVTAAGAVAASLRALLVTGGITVSAVRRVDPSLEDVFVGVLASQTLSTNG
jgi:ABC-2 type transport system ATP-binding protein